MKTLSYALVIVGVLTAACLPIPHKQRLTPTMEGTLTRSGLPMAAATVRSAAIEKDTSGRVCSASHFVETTTDAAGQFHIQPIQRQGWFVAMGDQRYAWELCVKGDQGWTRVFQHQLHSGSTGLGGTFTLTCEVATGEDAFKCNHVAKFE